MEVISCTLGKVMSGVILFCGSQQASTISVIPCRVWGILAVINWDCVYYMAMNHNSFYTWYFLTWNRLFFLLQLPFF